MASLSRASDAGAPRPSLFPDVRLAQVCDYRSIERVDHTFAERNAPAESETEEKTYRLVFCLCG
jgi:hypothetical protein